MSVLLGLFAIIWGLILTVIGTVMLVRWLIKIGWLPEIP